MRNRRRPESTVGAGRRRSSIAVSLLMTLAMVVGQASIASSSEIGASSTGNAVANTGADAGSGGSTGSTSGSTGVEAPTVVRPTGSVEVGPSQEDLAAKRSERRAARRDLKAERRQQRAMAAAGADPDHVSFTLEGCRNNGGIVLPIGGKFICPESAYTTGNLGKGWNELDLVPHRVTTNAGTAAPDSQTFKISITADHQKASAPGYDVISSPELNVAKSDASCVVTSGGQMTTSGVGGADQSIYRIVEVTQDKNTKCVFDYYERLALGSHLYPGSALHSNLLNKDLTSSGIGVKDVSIPVNEILPQEISKDMAASQGSDHLWNITKETTPGKVYFTNSCDAGVERSAKVDITVTWERLPATPNGDITVVTNIYATNPASRMVTASISDVIRSGTTVVDTVSSGPVDVPPASTIKVLTHTTTVPSGTKNLNDIATGTYIDKATGIPIPGETTASASADVQISGAQNKSAVITDTENISGPELSYSVDGISGAAGSLEPGYALGEVTKEAVTWTSETQSGDGSVTFHKTIYLDEPAITSGILSDTAKLVGSDGFKAEASAQVDIVADAKVELNINKTIPDVLDPGESATFDFEVRDVAGSLVATRSLTFSAGETAKSATVTGLAPGTYSVTELPAPGWGPIAEKTVTIDVPSCSGTVQFDNEAVPAKARVAKVTEPSGSEAGWKFNLKGPGVDETIVTTGSGWENFSSDLHEGTYTIAEVPQPGWDQTGTELDGKAVDSCEFVVDLPADADRTFSCVFTNVERGKIIVVKETDPDGSDQSFGFTSSYAPGSFSLKDGQSSDSGLLPPGTYSVSEDPTPGWGLTGASCDNGDDPSNIELGAGETITCTFSNLEYVPQIEVTKTCPAAAQIGDKITYSITVKNLGNEPLADVVVDDTLLGDLSGSFSDILAVGASETRTFDYTVSATDPDPLPNEVTATATGAESKKAVEDTDSCETDIEHNPGIDVTKTCPPSGLEGDVITFSITVENTGDEPLNDVVVNDPLLGGDLDGFPTTLAVGQSDTQSFEYTIPPESTVVTNEVTATGIGADSKKEASDTDSCETAVHHPAIDLVKTADPISGSPGDLVLYTYLVTNTGDVTLRNVTVDDDKLGHIGDIESLAPGESATLTKDFILPNEATTIVNVAIAAGCDDDQHCVQAEDYAVVTVILADRERPPKEERILPFTGSDIAPFAVAMAALVLMGAAFALATRRRREGS